MERFSGIQRKFWDQYYSIRNCEPGTLLEIDISILKEKFDENPIELLPLVHEIYRREEDDWVDFLPFIVLKHLPDKLSVELLLRTEEDIEKWELLEYPGFVEYLKHNPDPFVNRDMSMFEKTPEEKLLMYSHFPQDNLEEGSVNQEVLRTGIIRVQYPKGYWHNQKQRKFNSFVDREGHVFRGAKLLWPCEWDNAAIKEMERWVRSVTEEIHDPGIRHFTYDDHIRLIGLLKKDRDYFVIAPSWVQSDSRSTKEKHPVANPHWNQDASSKLTKEFDERFALYYERSFYGTADYMMAVFDEHPEELLPHVHKLMDGEPNPFYREILAVMVADVLPDKRSIEMLINEFGADEADFKGMAGFERYCEQYGDPFR